MFDAALAKEKGWKVGNILKAKNRPHQNTPLPLDSPEFIFRKITAIGEEKVLSRGLLNATGIWGTEVSFNLQESAYEWEVVDKAPENIPVVVSNFGCPKCSKTFQAQDREPPKFCPFCGKRGKMLRRSVTKEQGKLERKVTPAAKTSRKTLQKTK
jgi:hypothetical protein